MKPITPYELLAKYFSGNCTPNEELEILRWKNNNAENSEIFSQYKLIWNSKPLSRDCQPNVENALSAVNEILNKKKSPNHIVEAKIKHRMLRSVFVRKFAAIFMLALAIVALYQFVIAGYLAANTELIVANRNWTNSQDTLPDGSLVFLNSDSEIRYRKTFDEKIREVYLRGEAFFEVKPEKNRAFVVHTKGAEIRALGTSFNVNTSSAQGELEVIVETGQVEVKADASENDGSTSRNENRKVVLEAGTKARLSEKTKKIAKSQNTNLAYLDWRKQKIIFKETKLKDVLNTLEQVYRVKIQLANQDLLHEKLTAKFENQSIEAIVNVIKVTHNIDNVAGIDAIVVKKEFEEVKTMFGMQNNKPK